MDLLQLQYFRTVAQTENISRAAELLYVAQPNLSVSIRRLETDLGVTLFDRSRGKIKLTAAGRAFLETVEKTLDGLDEGIERMRLTDSGHGKRVSVASGIVDLIGDLLSEFLPAEVPCEFRQLCCANSEVAPAVLSGTADIGFLFGEPRMQGLEYTPLDDCERVLLMNKSHALAGKETASLADLKGQPLICNRSRDDEQLLANLARSAGFLLRQSFVCDDNRVEVSMLCAGGGVSIAPVQNYVKLKRTDFAADVVCVPLRENLPRCKLGMIRREGRLLTTAELKFYGMVDAFFRAERGD